MQSMHWITRLYCIDKQLKDIINLHSNAVVEPCISNGVSPFWHKDYPRVANAILTGPYSPLYHYCSMASKKPMSDIGGVRHRVDCLSTENSSKETFTALLFPFLSMLLIYVFTQRLSQISRAGGFCNV